MYDGYLQTWRLHWLALLCWKGRCRPSSHLPCPAQAEAAGMLLAAQQTPFLLAATLVHFQLLCCMKVTHSLPSSPAQPQRSSLRLVLTSRPVLQLWTGLHRLVLPSKSASSSSALETCVQRRVLRVWVQQLTCLTVQVHKTLEQLQPSAMDGTSGDFEPG